ncbi:diguanylate cyclase [Magnetovirga frankeli]|uniref:GGDEF domain-containing protein n=1 Tax=Magnetovirga frankeli TaxID=947516 RepID=UPI003D33B91E
MLIFATTLLQIYQSEKNYRTAAHEREEETLRRILDVAVRQVYEDIYHKTLEMGTRFIGRSDFAQAFAQAQAERQGSARLEAVLIDPFINGYVNGAFLSLEALKVYDTDWRALAIGRTASTMNIDAYRLDPGPSPVARQAMLRQGMDRLQALGGRWAGSRDAYYSLILPIGGLRLQGYLEVVINADMNLPELERLVEIPLSIHNLIKQRQIYDKSPAKEKLDHFQQIDYRIDSLRQRSLYEIRLYANVAEFDVRMRQQQTQSVLVSLLVSLTVLALVLWCLERLLVAPMRRLRSEIRGQTLDFTGEPVSTWGLLEFHDLAQGFNHLLRMAWQQQLVLEKRSITDELTQVPNRRALEQFLQAEKARAARCHDKLALLMVDIDFFKNYNDYYGHQAGDDCLREVAQLLQSALPRATDFVARYGGEEFIVVLPGTDQQGAVAVAERLLQQVREQRIAHAASEIGEYLSLSVGVGVCHSFEPGCIEQLKRHADKALYRAKHQGRDRVCVYHADDQPPA